VPTLALRASASLAAGVVAAAAGDGEAARRHLRDAVELFAEAGAPFETARARLELAEVLAAAGRTDEATREAATALGLCDGLGAAGQSARARTLLERLDGTRAPRGSAGAPSGQGAGSTPGRRGAGSLTPRQVEVLRLAAAGLDHRVIAERLGVGEPTILRHVRNACDRLGVRSGGDAVAAAQRLGLL
jgi:DNA-binding NarL/FixJ family response regulator